MIVGGVFIIRWDASTSQIVQMETSEAVLATKAPVEGFERASSRKQRDPFGYEMAKLEMLTEYRPMTGIFGDEMTWGEELVYDNPLHGMMAVLPLPIGVPVKLGWVFAGIMVDRYSMHQQNAERWSAFEEEWS